MLSGYKVEIADLAGLFGDGDVDAEVISAESIPQPYRELLVHPHRMTVTVERFYSGDVNVQVLDRRRDGDSYARRILLRLKASGRAVQFGIVRIRLNLCSEAVRDEILEEATPLGRILIHHDVLRRIEPIGYLRIRTAGNLMAHFGLAVPTNVWGRLAIIHCDGQPAIELLEILAPVP